jgi:hypothetical protein
MFTAVARDNILFLANGMTKGVVLKRTNMAPVNFTVLTEIYLI